jgi:hypothetical protein
MLPIFFNSEIFGSSDSITFGKFNGSEEESYGVVGTVRLTRWLRRQADPEGKVGSANGNRTRV